MSFALWSLLAGLLLISMALSGTSLSRLPVTAAMFYLAAGFALGPAMGGYLVPDPLVYSVLLERIAEVAVLISLFAVGLKLGLPLRDAGWRLPLRLAVLSMTVTVALVAALAMLLFHMSLGAAVLLGAILAPTDPVLASDVQVAAVDDRDRLRFSLTAEGGLNDGATFPYVMLGLGLLGIHELGEYGWRWWLIDVLWASVGGLAIGGLLGAAIGRLVVYLRSRHRESVGRDEFLALGLIALSYGAAVMCATAGFLAVFAAGLALQRVNERVRGGSSGLTQPAGLQNAATHAALATDGHLASAYMMQEVQGFNERLERLAEVVVVLLAGAMLAYTRLPGAAAWFIALLFLVVRPLAVWLGLFGTPVSRDQRRLMSWFGIRGIGSIYYLMFAINHGVARPLAEQLMALTLGVVAVSIVVHGVSVTPLMDVYQRRRARAQARL
jgi:NhaP-type Na+/H+ or K+/H+ antiporter